MKKLLIGMLSAIVLFMFGSALAEINIVTTDFVCYDFARAVCGDDASITMLIRPGTEVHTYDPTPSDIIKVANCDLFIYIGGESDSWVEGVLDSFEDKAPQTLRLFDCVEAVEEEETEEMTVHKSAEEADEKEYDEHIWTSPVNAVRMLRAVEEKVRQFGDYSADAYIAEIEAIDAEFRTLAQEADHSTLIFADRFPLLYFVREYGFNYKAAFSSCNAESDPAVRTVAALIDAVREESIPAVYVLELGSARLGNTIAEETGAKVLRFQSMQSISQADFEAGETYVTLMRRNLEALKEGLL